MTYGGFPKLGVIGVPHNKYYSILGSILGSPHFEKLPYLRFLPGVSNTNVEGWRGRIFRTHRGSGIRVPSPYQEWHLRTARLDAVDCDSEVQ